MKTIMTLALCLLVTAQLSDAAPHQPATKQISCVSAAIGVQASVNGTLSLHPISSGAFRAEGKLVVQVGPIRPQPNPPQTVLFTGQYDKIEGFEYATLGAVERSSSHPEVDMLYINFGDSGDRSDSYLELNTGTRYLLNCSRSD